MASNCCGNKTVTKFRSCAIKHWEIISSECARVGRLHERSDSINLFSLRTLHGRVIFSLVMLPFKIHLSIAGQVAVAVQFMTNSIYQSHSVCQRITCLSGNPKIRDSVHHTRQTNLSRTILIPITKLRIISYGRLKCHLTYDAQFFQVVFVVVVILQQFLSRGHPVVFKAQY